MYNKPYWNDPRYRDLPFNERLRTYERDSMIWDQTEALKQISESTREHNDYSPHLEQDIINGAKDTIAKYDAKYNTDEYLKYSEAFKNAIKDYSNAIIKQKWSELLIPIFLVAIIIIVAIYVQHINLLFAGITLVVGLGILLLNNARCLNNVSIAFNKFLDTKGELDDIVDDIDANLNEIKQKEASKPKFNSEKELLDYLLEEHKKQEWA